MTVSERFASCDRMDNFQGQMTAIYPNALERRSHNRHSLPTHIIAIQRYPDRSHPTVSPLTAHAASARLPQSAGPRRIDP
jgi:hypothetical protein